MARSTKILIKDNGLDVREVGYYSTPKFIAEYISKRLIELSKDGKKVLDPAVGKEELLSIFIDKNYSIDSFDIIRHKENYQSNYQQKNFIEFYKEIKNSYFFGTSKACDYDIYIANPPYNCHEVNYIKENKKELKSIFPFVGVHNMYSMFLAAIINIAKDGACIGVIISDSFFTARNHSALRKLILENCSIHDVILCPNEIFHSQNADVRTAILLLQKGTSHQTSKINVLNRPKSTAELKVSLKNKEFEKTSLEKFILSKNVALNQFIIGVPTEILDLFSNPSLKSLFPCITGISTGNDKLYLSDVQNCDYKYPFYKNPASRKFTTSPDAYLTSNFLEVSSKKKDFMVRNKPFLFKEGITCSSMGVSFSACYLPKDSTYGVNANIFPEPKDINWLIAYLNSDLVLFFLRGILIRSNMVTSGYVSNIPIIPLPNSVKNELSLITMQTIKGGISADDAVIISNNIIEGFLQLSESTIDTIRYFKNNLYKKV